MKTIEYYTVSQYGTEREFIKDPETARTVARLTGQKTINFEIRGLLQMLTDGAVEFREVLPPRKGETMAAPVMESAL
jgi:hypothetical protein